MAIRPSPLEHIIKDSANINRVLVTGHDGYIGSVLVRLLLGSGYDVTGLDVSYYGDCNFSKIEHPIRNIQRDIRDVDLRDLRGFDAIIHLAALSNDPVGELSPALTLDINFQSSVRLAELAKIAGIRRFIYASSCSLYGKTNREWVDETCPMDPLTTYAESKILTEEKLSCLADDQFSPIILRFATVYGVSQKLRVDLVVNNLVGWGITTGQVQILSDGTPWRPLIHVEDVATAYRFFLQAPLRTIHNQIINVGFNSENYQIREIAEKVAQSLPGTKVSFAQKPDRDSRSYRVDFGKFKKLSGLDPIWDLPAGIFQLVEAYRGAGLTKAEFTGRKFVRLNQIRHLIDKGRLDPNLRLVA